MPNELCPELHKPNAGDPAARDWPLWLGDDDAGSEELKAVLRPYPTEWMTMWPVRTRAGNVRNNDPSLIERVELME